MVKLYFIEKDGKEIEINAEEGLSILEIAHKNNIRLEGACGGSLACSTCHIIIEDQQYYERLTPPSDEEDDMLDLALFLTKTSRLGCQIIVTKELEGMRIRLPSGTRNILLED